MMNVPIIPAAFDFLGFPLSYKQNDQFQLML